MSMNDDEVRVLQVPGVEVEDVQMARSFVRRHLSSVLSEDVVRDMELAASELVTNAWAHESCATVAIAIAVGGGRATVTIASTSPPTTLLADVEEWTMPAPNAPAGRGLAIVREVADNVEIEQRGASLAISVHRDIDGPRENQIGAGRS